MIFANVKAPAVSSVVPESRLLSCERDTKWMPGLQHPAKSWKHEGRLKYADFVSFLSSRAGGVYQQYCSCFNHMRP